MQKRVRRFALPALLLAFVLLAGWYSTVIPLGEGPDEPGHAEFAFFVAREGRLPDSRRNEVLGEGHQPPLAYWLLQPAARSIPLAQRRVILANNPNWVWAGGTEPAAFGWRSADRWPYRGDVAAWHAMRLFSVLCGAVTVLLTWAIGRRLGLRPWTAWGAAALLAVWPQFVFHSALVSNDPLLWTLSALTLWLLLDPAPIRWWAIQIGLVVGAALLVKQSALVLLPLVVLGIRGWGLGERHGEQRAKSKEQRAKSKEQQEGPDSRSLIPDPRPPLLLFAATVLLVAGWWYGRNLVLYGDPFGLTMYKGEFASQTFSPWRWADWSAGLRALGASLVARFGWMNVVAPVWVYWLAAGIGVAAIFGWLHPRRTRTNTKASAYPIPDPRSPIPKTSFLLPTLLLLALGWTFLFAVLSGQVGWQGRFVLPAAPVLAIGLAVGLGRLVRRNLALWLALVLMLAVTLALPTTAIRPAYPRLVVAAQPERPLLVRWVPDLTPPIELRGLALPPTAQVGQTLRVGTLWQALGPQDRPWTLFVHLAKPGDRYETFAVNVQPQNGAWPATRWTDGDWWEDSTMLDLPNDLPPGVYDVRMGWFDERDGQRVGVRTAAGELTGDYATVGEIEVLP